MRFDDIGLFWQDLPSKTKKGEYNRPMPPIPETGWKAPRDFPNLKDVKVKSIDTETYDPNLKERGPGWARGDGHIVGISVAVEDHKPWYFPMRHEVNPHENMDPDHVLAWARDNLTTPGQYTIGANIIYDIGWLRQEGVHIPGPYVDVQYAGGLLSERDPVALDFLARRYLGDPKVTELLYQWCADYYGGNPTQNQRANIYRSPPSLVGPYAEADADLPLRLANKFYPILVEQGLWNVFDMENRLIPLLLDMRFAGVRIDLEKAEQVKSELDARTLTLQDQLNNMVGRKTNVNASADLAKAFDVLGLGYGFTAKGAPSFTKGFLKSVDHPFVRLIEEIRTNEKLAGTFIQSYILDSQVNGYVYGQFHPLRGDDGGTRSGRYSSSTPNLQNIPSRHPVLAPLIRGMFVPDEGHLCIRAYDYSQIEYRFLAHFAIGHAGDELRARYNRNPHTDYHQLAIDLVYERTGQTLDRKPAKTINFGLLYGMGKKKLAKSLGLTKKGTDDLFMAYHAGNPHVSATMEYFMEQAKRTGEIRTVLGRRSQFDMWEPEGWVNGVVPLPYKQAIKRYGDNIQRAATHKALNRVLQGSAADEMKMAMLLCYEQGLFREIGPPRLTVHDELVFSDPGGYNDTFDEIERVMTHALPLRIPLLVDAEIGPDWGHAKYNVHTEYDYCKENGWVM